MPHVAQAVGAGDLRPRGVRAGGVRECRGEVADGPRRAAGHVVGPRCGLARQGQDVRPGDVADVHEVTPLAPVLEDLRGGAGGEAAAEDAGDPCVRGVARHPRAVDVVVAQRRQRHAALAREGRAQVLLMQLGRGVDAARISRGALADQERLEVAPAARAARLEAAGVEICRGARRRRRVAVARAAVAALAIHDHAAGEDEGPAKSRPGGRREQFGGAEAVVGDVVGQVAEVGAEADHRGLVADGVGVVQRRGDRVRVADVAEDRLGGRVQVVGLAGVGCRQQRVEHADVVAAGDEQVDDVRADEAGAAGDEDHGRTVRISVPVEYARRPPASRTTPSRQSRASGGPAARRARPSGSVR